MLAAVDLHQHAFWHTPSPEAVLWGAAAARTAQSGLDQYVAHCGTAQVNALAFPKQFGEVTMVGAGIVVAGQLHHGSRGSRGDSVVGPTASVPMSQSGAAVLAVSG